MSRRKRPSAGDPRIQAAIEELKGLILAGFPQACFEVYEGQDIEGDRGVFLKVTVDVEDRFEVSDLFMDREVDMVVEEGLPIFVRIVRPLTSAFLPS